MSADGSIIIDVVLNDNGALNQLNGIQSSSNNINGQGPTRLSSALGTVGKAATLAVGAVTAVSVATFALAKPLVEAAASAQALNAQFSSVFGNLEKEATSALNGIAEQTNILPSRLQASFTQIAAFAKTTGADTSEALDLSSRATLAAADSAAFYDRSIEDVTESLQSFLKGEIVAPS